MKLMQRMAMLLFLMLGWISTGHATTVMYTELAWMERVNGYDIAGTGFDNAVSNFDTVTAGNVVFSSPGVPLEVRSDYGMPYNSGAVLYPAFNQQLKVDLPRGVYAFGFDLGELEPLLGSTSTATLGNVVLSTGESFPGPYKGNSYPTYAFFGFFSDVPITSLSMWPHAQVEPIIDNFEYGRLPADPSPEPSSLLLLSSGVLGLMANRWRKRHR